jgi:hypothetical protein
MSLFQRKTPEPEPPRTTGLDVLRQALKNRNSRINGTHGLKDELKVPFSAIADFINENDGALTGPQLDLAAKFIWGDRVAFDPESRMLRSTNQAAAKSVSIYPGQSSINLPPGFVPGPTGAPPPLGPRPVKDPPAKAGPVWPHRDGWA